MRSLSVALLCALLLVFVALMGGAHGAHSFSAHRVAQFDRDGERFGSRRTLINNQLASVDWSSPSASSDLHRKVVAVRIGDLSVARLDELVNARRAAGVLIVLPAAAQLDAATEAETVDWRALEQFMLTRALDLPVYFAFEDAELGAIMHQLGAELMGVDSGTRYHVSNAGAEAVEIASPASTNIVGWLRGTAPSTSTTDSAVASDTSTLPIVAIVASYDTFAASPTLAFGTDHSSSAVVAVLELARIFAKLFADARTKPAYNLLFAITGAGRLQGGGLKHWLNTVDQRVVDALEFALCFEAIGSGDAVHLHVHRAPKNPEVVELYAHFERAARSLAVPFTLAPKRGNLTTENYEWPHERFSRKKVLAATLSARADPQADLVTNSSIFDRRAAPATVVRNIRIAAEAIARHIYGVGASVFGSGGTATAVSEHFVASWLRTLASEARVDAFLGKKAPVLAEIEKSLSKYTVDVVRSSFALAGDVRFFKSPQEPHTLSIHSVKPVMFDLFLSLAVMAYTFGVYAVAKGDNNVARLLSGGHK